MQAARLSNIGALARGILPRRNVQTEPPFVDHGRHARALRRRVQRCVKTCVNADNVLVRRAIHRLQGRFRAFRVIARKVACGELHQAQFQAFAYLENF